jgi:hypothetical protein
VGDGDADPERSTHEDELRSAQATIAMSACEAYIEGNVSKTRSRERTMLGPHRRSSLPPQALRGACKRELRPLKPREGPTQACTVWFLHWCRS